jgi:hypothetical protein
VKLTDLAKDLAALGLPILGTVLGGPAGGMVGKLLANAVGQKPGEHIIDVLTASGDALRKAQQFEAEHGKALMQMHLIALEKSDAGQVEVNKIEAASASLFKSGWRPAAGWVCSVALAYHYVLQPLLSFLMVNVFSDNVVTPAFDMSTLMTLLFGLLGLGAYRTVERVKGKV